MILGNGMNGVTFSCGNNRNSPITQELHDFMRYLLSFEIIDSYTFDIRPIALSMRISSTSEPYGKHAVGGPHRSGLAIDIAAINGKGITQYYQSDPTVSSVCDKLQIRAIDYGGIWENFGPLICLKSDRDGLVHEIKKDTALISMHKTHLHFSVRGAGIPIKDQQ